MFKYCECSFEGVESYSAEHFCIKVNSRLELTFGLPLITILL